MGAPHSQRRMHRFHPQSGNEDPTWCSLKQTNKNWNAALTSPAQVFWTRPCIVTRSLVHSCAPLSLKSTDSPSHSCLIYKIGNIISTSQRLWSHPIPLKALKSSTERESLQHILAQQWNSHSFYKFLWSSYLHARHWSRFWDVRVSSTNKSPCPHEEF